MGIKILFRGTVSREKIETGRVSFLLRKIFPSQVCNLSPDFPGYIEFLAIDHKTNERLLIRGVTEIVLKSQIPIAAKPKKKGMTNNKYAEELKRVQVARLEQTDALVNIQFIAQHTGRAVSSIYRDVKKKLLPEPFKQGRSSRWSFSNVEAYAHGRATEIIRSPS